MIELKDFIKYGYFPKELPPPFNTMSFAENSEKIHKEWRNKGKTIKKNFNETLCAIYSIPRINYSRRRISIPNPLHQYELTSLLVDNWEKIISFLKEAKLSASFPVIDNEQNRALITKKTFSEYKRAYVRGSFNRLFEVRTDISRFYPTIYTHAIPWALHTKEIAKKQRSTNSLLGNEIDKKMRSCQSGQTIGIPIGPDTSFLVAEIIATALDKKIIQKFKDIKGYRYIDDYHLFVKTQEEAEKLLKYLQSLFSEFELDINDTKTDIIKFPEPFEESWVIQIGMFPFAGNRYNQKKKIGQYFSLVFKLNKEYNTDSILKYAIKRLYSVRIYKDNWDFYESLLLKTLLAEPRLLPEIFNILYYYKDRVHVRFLKQVIDSILLTHSDKGHSFEISWSLWIAKTFKFKIRKKLAENIFNSNDVISRIVAFDLMNSGYISTDINIESTLNDLIPESFSNENWILTYEVLKKGWVSSEKLKYLKNNEYFKILKKYDISFYDDNLQVMGIDKYNKKKIKSTNVDQKEAGNWFDYDY